MSDRLKKFLACPHKRVQDFTEVCLDCRENIYTTAAEIQKQELDNERREREREEFIKNQNESGW